MAYKDAAKLKKSDFEDLSELERQELEMYAGIEVDALLARLQGYSRDFKQLVAIKLYGEVQ